MFVLTPMKMFSYCVTVFCSADRVWFSLQILHHLQPERPDCREKLDKILQQIKWPNFPGVVVMLLKVWLVFFVARASLA